MDTETTVKQRIAILLQHLGISQIELSRQIGVDQSNISIAGSDRRPSISKSLVDKITKRHNEINPWWLLTGEGEMLVTEKTEKKPASVVEEESPDYGRDPFQELRSLLVAYEERIKNLEAAVDEMRDLLNDVRLGMKKDGGTKVGDGEEI